MRLLAALLALTILGASGDKSAPPADCGARPAWCQPGYVCLPTSCAATTAVQLELLSSEVITLRGKKDRRWRCVAGPGAGVFFQIDNGKLSFDAAPIAGALVCGYAF